MKSFRIILIVLLSYLFVGSVYASEAKGLEIATEVDVRDKGFGDTTSTMTMTLFDQYGNSTSRKIRNRTLEGTDEGDLSLVIFDTPADVKGTAFLSHTKKSGSDDQWLYLPALKPSKTNCFIEPSRTIYGQRVCLRRYFKPGTRKIHLQILAK